MVNKTHTSNKDLLKITSHLMIYTLPELYLRYSGTVALFL